MDQLDVAVIQLCSSQILDENLELIANQLTQLETNVDLVSLPENALQFKVSSKHPFGIQEKGDWQKFFVDWSNKLGCAFHIGGIPLLEEGQVFNSSFWVSPGKSPVRVYDKLHLFDLELPDLKILESETFVAGSKVAIGEYKGWRLGFAICYDIRFSPLINRFLREQVDIAFFPSAFTQKTGASHWEVLNRSRAIELQSYVVSAAQCGTHRVSHDSDLSKSQRFSFGQSLVVDPWGEIQASCGNYKNSAQASELCKAKLRKEHIRDVRTHMPIRSHLKDQVVYSEDLKIISL